MTLKLGTEAAPPTPGAGIKHLYFDTSTLPNLRGIDAAGNDNQIGPIQNASAAGQSPVAATRTYLTGSNVTVPVIKLKVGAIYRCRFAMTKTAAGVATSTIDVCVGTTGTTADTARLSFTKPLGTAVADEGWVDIYVVVKTIGATGVIVGEIIVDHNLATTGHMGQQVFIATVTSGTFDTTVASLIIGVCFTSGAADAITISQCMAELVNN